MKMNHLALMLMLGLVANFTMAQDEREGKVRKPAKLEGVSEEDRLKVAYDWIYKDVTKENDEFMAKLRAEPDRNKQRKIYQTMRPDHTAELDEVLALARKSPDSIHTMNILFWGQRLFTPEQLVEANKILVDHHINKDQFASIVTLLARSGNEPIATFEEIRDKTSSSKVKQMAIFVMAERYLMLEQTKEEGIEYLKELMDMLNAEKTNPKLASKVSRMLFVAQNLGVGSVAPDIVGLDHAGVKFQLSDYLGRVVLLKFWGHW